MSTHRLFQRLIQPSLITSLAIFGCLFQQSLLSAREVDQYMGWGHELTDSGEIVDEQLRLFFLKGLIALNSNDSKGRLSCEDAIIELKSDFFRPTYQLIEEWIDYAPYIDRYPSHQMMDNMTYLKQSHIQSQPLWVPLARGVKVHGIYAGSDKFGHFTSFGSRYAKKYWKALKEQKKKPRAIAHQLALKAAIEYGLRSERTVVGKMASGVLSYGDLEANFQGLLFTLEFCADNSKHALVYNQTEKQWEIENFESISLKDYVNPDWDETFNNSRYVFYKWDNTSEIFKERYCPYYFKVQDKVKERFTTYRARYTPSEAKKFQVEFESTLPVSERQSAHDLFTFCGIAKP